jgi:hypothetical protein
MKSYTSPGMVLGIASLLRLDAGWRPTWITPRRPQAQSGVKTAPLRGCRDAMHRVSIPGLRSDAIRRPINFQFSIFNSQFPKCVAGIDEMKPVRMETETVRMEMKPVRMETKAIRVEMKAIRMEMEVIRMEMKPVRMKTGIIRIQTEAVRMETGFISSLDFSVFRPATNNANILIN